MRIARTVDALGSRCPVPVRLLGRAVARRHPGDLVELLADDPLIAVDLPAWCHRHGHLLVRMEVADGRHRAVIRVGTGEFQTDSAANWTIEG